MLGAGGVLGGARLVGGLHALASETGWDPGRADYIVGTSAGSAFGRPDAPHASLADAVAASCAITGFYRPVTIEGEATSTEGSRRCRIWPCSPAEDWTW